MGPFVTNSNVIGLGLSERWFSPLSSGKALAFLTVAVLGVRSLDLSGTAQHCEFACPLCHVNAGLFCTPPLSPGVEALSTLKKSSFLISEKRLFTLWFLSLCFVLLGAREQGERAQATPMPQCSVCPSEVNHEKNVFVPTSSSEVAAEIVF